jgi:penicillin-binding protein 1A
LVSLDPQTGGIVALLGGFDFFRSKFNRAAQAKRQPGSSFKPFIYAAALDHGYTPASIINDAPVVFDDPTLEGKWRPENYTGEFFGPTRLREGLVKSRNLVSIRLLLEMGVGRGRDFVRRFGFADESLPRDLSLALGSGALTPLELARGFAVFANGGYLIEPYFIDRVEDADGRTLQQSDYTLACVKCFVEKLDPVLLDHGYLIETESETAAKPAAMPATLKNNAEPQTVMTADVPGLSGADAGAEPPLKRYLRQAEQVLDPEISFIINSMLRDVILRGTGVRARDLGRNDLAGKTGTTNDQNDAWFSGFNHKYVATAWIGFDSHAPLGASEAGSAAALPIWMDYMREALKDVPEQLPQQPPGIVTIRIDAQTGLLATAKTAEPMFEIFRAGNVPTQESAPTEDANVFSDNDGSETGATAAPPAELF